jgi:hypothetical protein
MNAIKHPVSEHWRRLAAELIFGDYGDQEIYGDLERYGIIWRLSGKTLALWDEYGFRDVQRYDTEAEAEAVADEFLGSYRVWMHGNYILEGEDEDKIRSGEYVREGVEHVH